MSQKEQENMGYIISETHWDREWYLTFQEFRKWLVRLIDDLLENSDKVPNWRAFMLDGQTLVLEDYLQVRPEKEEKLRELIQKDKINIGPFYCLADEFLESGEGLIRNLLLGHKISKKYGNIMKVGYVPDTFGHIAQLPQILKGFNIKYACGFRGYPPIFGNHEEYKGKNEDTPLEHIWQSPNPNYSIIMYHLLTGYGNMSNACISPMIEPDGNKVFIAGIGKLADAYSRLSERQKSNLYPLFNGSDHIQAEWDIPELISLVNNDDEIQEDIPIKLKHATLEEYFKDLEAQNLDLPILSGEWRGSMYTQVTPACISTRMYLKLQNYECQRELERYAEPISSMAWSMGGTYDNNLIWESWRWTIKNHPHDSICGCSLDRVHDDMETRNKWSLDISSDMGLNAMAEIVSGIDDKALFSKIKEKYGLKANSFELITVFNTNAFTEGIYQIIEGLIAVNPNMKYRLFDSQANEINEFLIQGIEDYRKLEGAQYIYKRFHNQWGCVNLVLSSNSLNQFGYNSFMLIAVGEDKEKSQNISDTEVIGKKFIGKNIEVSFNQDGSFNIRDNGTNSTYENLNIFEDMADDGDEYDYAPLREEIPIFSKNLKADFNLIEENKLRSVVEVLIQFEIPEKLIEIDERTRIRSETKVFLNIKSLITIFRNSDVVRIKTEFENNAKSHRLRAIFPTSINSEYSYADDHFMVMKRNIEKPKDDGWYQLAQTIYHQDTFVDINNGKHGLSLFNRGLPEFEIKNYETYGLKGDSIALTLVRGVEWLSQRGHLGRKTGLNGPNLPTPGAQCLRKFSVEYAVYPHKNNWDEGNSYPEAYSYCYPPKFFDKKQMNNLRTQTLNDLPADYSFLKIENPKIILTCFKKSEEEFSDNTGIIVRIFNPTSHSEASKILISEIFKKAYRTNMLESEENEIPIKVDGNIKFLEIKVDSNEILTLKLK